MAFNIQTALSALDNGFAVTSAYDIMITGPSMGASLQMSEVQTSLPFRADAVTFPGRQVTTSEFLTIGPVQKVAYDSLYAQVVISFILSPDFAEKKYFQRWQSLAVGFATHTDQKPRGLFQVGYYDEYVGTVDIKQYDQTGGEPIYTAKLIEAYPTTVSSMSSRWDETEVNRLAVEFSYRYFVDDSAYLDQVRQQQQNGTSTTPSTEV